MTVMRKLLLPWVLALLMLSASAQRTYRPHSVLASGNWFKIAVSGPGVYRLDLPFLNSLGITGNIPSSQIRLFGNGGAMLPESNSASRPDDLQENALLVSDGGDGTLNGQDFVLFYAEGPNHWKTDTANQSFTYQQNLYSTQSFYFLSVGGAGLRIAEQASVLPGNTLITSYDEHYAHELDTINFLASGREWYGEELSSLPGRSLSKTFTLPFPDILPQSAIFRSSFAARSVNTPLQFRWNLGTQVFQQLDANPVGTGIYDLFAREVSQTTTFIPQGNTSNLTVSMSQGSFNSQGWLNRFEFFFRRNLALINGQQLLFRNWSSIGQGRVQYQISNADASTQIWDVSNTLAPVKMRTSLNQGSVQFTSETETLREFVAFNTTLVPTAVGKVANQDLHASPESDLVIISYPAFLSEANRLADFHRSHDKQRVMVVSTEQVFNEFGSGSPDPSALRDFMKMLYDRYRSSWNESGKYLLLLGRASYDYKDRVAGNTNLVPAYETPASLDPLSTYTSDDFFGFLDDAEDINQSVLINQLDIGIGRIPARDVTEVKNFVDKELAYFSPASFGPWRNEVSLVADDEDQNLHLEDAESLSSTVSTTAPAFNQQKIYLDAFPQENASSGGRYPQANAAVNSGIFNGTLIWNYTGHGGAARLAEEVILDQSIANQWNNANRLPLFVTATCDFVPYDNPVQHSLGENLLTRPVTGAIALMSTTRVVFAFSNRIINSNYLRLAFQRDSSGNYRSLGRAMQDSKNETYRTSADLVNNRKFTLIGDPAMTLAFPVNQVIVEKLNGKALSNDTLRAGESVLIEGFMADRNGALLQQFQGTSYLTLFDKVQLKKTLGNDASSLPAAYPSQESVLFKGKATVVNGRFEFRFKLPRDINYQYGPGKASLYAQNGEIDGNGLVNQIIIGGISANMDPDHEGPGIRAWLNDEKFVNGSIINPSPVLVLRLSDSSGINTAGAGVGHDLVATLDNDNNKYFILNNFYESDKDDYQHGGLRFQLPQLDAGAHSLRIKAWDVLNNSSEYVLEFTAVDQQELRLDHVLNYPNPFTTKTQFWFEHNFPGVGLDVRIEIFTVGGRLIKTLSRTINTDGNRSSEVEWDGRDDYGDRLGKGVYLYRLRVRTPDRKSAERWEKLVIL